MCSFILKEQMKEGEKTHVQDVLKIKAKEFIRTSEETHPKIKYSEGPPKCHSEEEGYIGMYSQLRDRSNP